MRLRPLTPEDADACYALYHRTVHGGTGAFYTAEQQAVWAPAQPRDPERWAQVMRAHFTVAAIKRRKIVGFFTLEADAHLDFAYVALEEMGKGTAQTLYEACEAEARRMGWTRMTTEASFLARKFFLKRGWEVEARQTVIRDGIGLDNFRMFKTL